MAPRSKDSWFRVHLCDFVCEGLIPKRDACEAYLHIEFDTRLWRTDPEPSNISPEWGFKAGFPYSTPNLEQLRAKHLRIHCLNKVNNAPIGRACVDLHTIACGPTHFQLTLLSNDELEEPRGTLKFTCVMKMISPNVTATCQDLTLTMQGCSAPASLEIFSNFGNVSQKPVKVEHSGQGVWQGPFTFSFSTTLQDLLKYPSPEYLQFVVIDEFGVKQGEALLEYRKWFTMKADLAVTFKIPVTYTYTDGENEPESFGTVGLFEGTVVYNNLPTIAQLVTGTYVDGEVEGGQSLVEGLPFPDCLPEAPPVWQDPAERLGLENLANDQLQGEEYELKADDLDDKQLADLLVQIDLPPPWEKRRERAGGRMYFFDPRSRKMTWKDPRFLPENWDQKIDPNTGKVYFQYHKTRQTTYLDPRCCPSSWDMRLSKGGDIYFAHLAAMRTTFQDPRGLPDHIEPALDDLGRMYFRNHDTRTTAWEDPRSGQQEVVLSKWRHQQSISWMNREVLREIEQRQEAEPENADEPEIQDAG